MNPPLLPSRRRAGIAAFAVTVAALAPAAADTVTRRDGSRLEGRLVSVDGAVVSIETAAGLSRVPREDVASIAFDAPASKLKVEIRNVRSDDAADVSVEGETVITDARDGGSWIDITPRLKEGNNRLGLRIRNDRGSWAYRIHLRINGEVVPVSCGTPLKREDPCTAFGHTGFEIGVIDVGPIWLHVDRTLARAEVLP